VRGFKPCAISYKNNEIQKRGKKIMKIKIEEGTPETIETELLILGIYKEGLDKTAEKINQELDKEITRAIEKKEFTAEYGQIKILSTIGKFKARNILLFGLGEKENSTISTLKKAAGSSARTARDLIGVKNFVTILHENETKEKNTKSEKIQAITEGILLGAYQFTKYKTQNSNTIKKLENATILVNKKTKEDESALEKGEIIGKTANFTRELVNESGSFLTPEEFEKISKIEAEKNKIKITIFDKKEIEKKGMNGIISVNKGSAKEPRFIILEYKGSTGKKIALVGKGITFDSGGLNIKSTEGIETMKSDMAGAATVLGTIIAAAKLKLPVHAFGIMALTENMTGSNAYKPGDIIKTHSGKTIEVLNTDAEGRIILADTLSYTEKEIKPDAIIDIATLTGACVVALGSIAAGMMGDEEIIKKIQEASKKSGEKIWQLPLWEEYTQQIKSDFADVRNIGIYSREAGAITAAAFLKTFVEKTPWAHIDIAGTAYTNTEKELTKKGGTGWGIKLLTTILEQWK
jgi:leucyl aminopeptidase